MKLEPYWRASAPSFKEGAMGAPPAQADVVVIGAGFTGLSTGLSLARAGADVVVLDAGYIAHEASGRNGGHCNTGTAQSFVSLADNLGLETAKRYYLAFSHAVDYVERTIADEGIDCDFMRRGKLKLASKASHLSGLARNAKALRTHLGEEVRLLSASEVRDEIASDAFHGGLLDSRGAQMHMGKFAVGLARAAAARGARIYQHTAVTKLTPREGHRYGVRTVRGDIEAGRVLLATGCSHQGPFAWWQRRVVPVGSFVLVSEPLDDALIARTLPARRNYVTSLNIGNYFRLTADNRLVWGGRARFARSNPRSDLKSGRILQAALARLVPDLANVRFDYCWGGMVEATVDRLPRAGQHQGLYYALGYSGHGTQMGVYMGDVMADVMLGRDRANPWARSQWPALPGYAGRAWFLPLAGLYYKMKDVFS